MGEICPPGLLGLIGAIALFLLPVCIQMVTVSISYIYGVGPGAFLGQRGYVNTAVYMAMDVAACYYVYAALGAALSLQGGKTPRQEKTGRKAAELQPDSNFDKL